MQIASEDNGNVETKDEQSEKVGPEAARPTFARVGYEECPKSRADLWHIQSART